MSDWNELENQLRSWTPRGPSEKVKQAIFGTAVVRGAGRSHTWAGHPTWHWLAPVMAMFVLGLFVVGRNPAVFVGTHGVEFSMGEPERASFYMNNSVQVTSFDWTNHKHSLTTPPPVAPTNSLFQ
jgi:hypothetical protein